MLFNIELAEETKKMKMNQITTCNMTDCAYNRQNCCRTLGITVGPHTECNTFRHASTRGGFIEIQGGVGASSAADCEYNDSIRVYGTKR